MTTLTRLKRGVTVVGLGSLSACNGIECADEPLSETVFWHGFPREISSPVAPLQFRELQRERELDLRCRLAGGTQVVEAPTPRIAYNGATVALVQDDYQPTAWWPAEGTWPAGEIMLTSIEERSGASWQINEPITVLTSAEPVDTDLSGLAGRVFRLTSASDSGGLLGILEEPDLQRLHIGFTDELEPRGVAFDVPTGETEGQCVHPLITREPATGGVSVLLPERNISYTVHENNPAWDNITPLVGPISATLWPTTTGLMGRGTGRLSLTAAVWSDDLTPEDLSDLLYAIGVEPEQCGTDSSCVEGSLWDLQFSEVTGDIPIKECGDNLETPPFLCAVSTIPLGGGPLLIALLALRRRRETWPQPHR